MKEVALVSSSDYFMVISTTSRLIVLYTADVATSVSYLCQDFKIFFFAREYKKEKYSGINSELEK